MCDLGGCGPEKGPERLLTAEELEISQEAVLNSCGYD